MAYDRQFAQIKKDLETCGQSHLLRFWDDLDATGRAALTEQIRDLDLGRISDWVERLVKNAPQAPVQRLDFEPAPAYEPEPRDDTQKRKYFEAMELGKKLISEGRVAGFVVAGGQGTRLGFEGPKGCFEISPVRNKPLFQVFAETIAAVSRRYGSVCPWYVMTSPLNHGPTVEFFRSRDFFGLGRENVVIFQQGTLPNFDFEGHILLDDKGSIARSPDGHGGSIKALCRSGALDDMKRRGVEYLSYWQVDNPLVNLFDPLFIGLHVLDGAEMSSKAVIKNDPEEKVGNFCLIDGKVTVIEYSDLPRELARKRNADGSLVFHLGSIAIHIINTAFVERLNGESCSLPLHRAIKKIAHVDAQGNHVEPEDVNGVKLESFIFDAVPMAKHSIILEIVRAEQFAPTKNATGTDSAESTRAMMVERAARWLERAGVSVPRRPDGTPGCLIEIAPGFALDPQELASKREQIPPIRPGDRVYLAQPIADCGFRIVDYQDRRVP
ncbi:MAG: UDPGP type 1 family protein [Sedimentisphaerales bacterium]|nr:UDPGP type 1 family protein [Sedimentisphaerales bacterium]